MNLNIVKLMVQQLSSPLNIHFQSSLALIVLHDKNGEVEEINDPM